MQRSAFAADVTGVIKTGFDESLEVDARDGEGGGVDCEVSIGAEKSGGIGKSLIKERGREGGGGGDAMSLKMAASCSSTAVDGEGKVFVNALGDLGGW